MIITITQKSTQEVEACKSQWAQKSGNTSDAYHTVYGSMKSSSMGITDLGLTCPRKMYYK